MLKTYLLLLFTCFSLSVFSQNFKLSLGGSYLAFKNINERPVSFKGYGVNYTYFVFKKVGVMLGYNIYAPTTYYGLFNTYTTNGKYKLIPYYITGGATSFDLGVILKIADPESKKILLYSDFSTSFFHHEGKYGAEAIPEIFNNFASLHGGLGFVFKIGSTPLYIAAGYNFVPHPKPYDYIGLYSTSFSSYLNFKAGINLPIMRGPVPADIKPILY